jgi:hypothetical protein
MKKVIIARKAKTYNPCEECSIDCGEADFELPYKFCALSPKMEGKFIVSVAQEIKATPADGLVCDKCCFSRFNSSKVCIKRGRKGLKPLCKPDTYFVLEKVKP